MKSSWWFQPFWKICSSNWIISPGRVENKKIFETTNQKLLRQNSCKLPFPSVISSVSFFVPPSSPRLRGLERKTRQPKKCSEFQVGNFSNGQLRAVPSSESILLTSEAFCQLDLLELLPRWTVEIHKFLLGQKMCFFQMCRNNYRCYLSRHKMFELCTVYIYYWKLILREKLTVDPRKIGWNWKCNASWKKIVANLQAIHLWSSTLVSG